MTKPQYLAIVWAVIAVQACAMCGVATMLHHVPGMIVSTLGAVLAAALARSCEREAGFR
jgi:hypothetical protein